MRNWARFPNERVAKRLRRKLRGSHMWCMLHEGPDWLAHKAGGGAEAKERSTGGATGSARQSYPDKPHTARPRTRSRIEFLGTRRSQSRLKTYPSATNHLEHWQRPVCSCCTAAAASPLHDDKHHTARAQAARALSAPPVDTNAGQTERHRLSMVTAAVSFAWLTRGATSPPAARRVIFGFTGVIFGRPENPM